MSKSNDHEIKSSLGFRVLLELLLNLNRSRVPSMDNSTNQYDSLLPLNRGRVLSMDNSTQQYDSFLLRGLQQAHNMTFNNTWQHIRSDYDAVGAGDVVPDECFPFLAVLDFFHLYYIPTIILTGLVGNLLSCVVFLNTHLKMRSSSYYLAALSAADFGFLATLLLVWLNSNVGVQVFNKDGWCQGLVYISSVCSFLSVWLIVAFTVERFIAIQYPLHRPRMCTVARAKAIVALLAVVALLSHLYSFVTAGLVRQDDGSDVCDMLEEYRENNEDHQYCGQLGDSDSTINFNHSNEHDDWLESVPVQTALQTESGNSDEQGWNEHGKI